MVQAINRHLDNFRKNAQKKYVSGVDEAKRLKKCRHIFLANFEELSGNALDVLSDWFKRIPELYEAYMCKETFRDIYNQAITRDDAERLFDMWINAVPEFPEFEPMRNNMSERKEHILNYWLMGVTNAYTESVNNLIKKIEKAGRGYKFETLRERCLLEINAPERHIPHPRDVEFVEVDTDTYRTCNSKKYELGSAAVSPTIQGSVTFAERLELFLEVEDSKNRELDTVKRLAEYYRRLNKLIKERM